MRVQIGSESSRAIRMHIAMEFPRKSFFWNSGYLFCVRVVKFGEWNFIKIYHVSNQEKLTERPLW